MVLAVIAVLGAIAAPAVAGDARGDASDAARAARDVVGMLARARAVAMDRGTSARVVIDPAAGRAWTFALDHGALRLVGDERIDVDAGVTLLADGPRVAFTFEASGAAFGAPLAVRGRDGVRRIVVDPWSGEAHAEAP